ncbi:MAG: non-heme ferritin [Rhodothermaceae bacterium]
MLSEKMIDKLNEQINLEHYSANLYLQMSSWAHYRGFPGSAAFLDAHSTEEMQHMHKLFSYVVETGAYAIVGEIKAPSKKMSDLQSLFQSIYDHEVLVTKKINELVELALKEKDFSTFNFLQWYCAEQHEEESLFKSILDKFELIGSEGQALYFVDREIGNLLRSK